MSNVMLPRLVAALMLGAALCAPALAQPAPPLDKAPDATLRSTPETVIWGYFAADAPPVLRIRSGQTVRIDTVSHSGMNTGRSGHLLRPRRHSGPTRCSRTHRHPPQGAASQGRQRPCPDRADLCRRRRARRHAGGAHHRARAPGALRGEQQQSRHRRAARPAAGPSAKIIKFDLARNVALFSDDIEVPLHPFMGIMAVAPPRDPRTGQLAAALALGRQHGFQQAHRRRDALSAGVQQRGAVLHRRLACGAGRRRGRRHRHRGVADRDPAIHRAQGRGQPACAGRARRTPPTTTPWASISISTRRCRKRRRRPSPSCATGRACRRRTPMRSPASAVDFRVGEAVDAVQMVYGMIPKKLFKQNPEYWSKK